jgi:hypothetical protein
MKQSTILLVALFVLCTAPAAEGDLNRLLQREFRTAISRHVACDSQGYCYLLTPPAGTEDERTFTLQASRKPHPDSITDFLLTVPLPALPGQARSSCVAAGLAVDASVPTGMHIDSAAPLQYSDHSCRQAWERAIVFPVRESGDARPPDNSSVSDCSDPADGDNDDGFRFCNRDW